VTEFGGRQNQSRVGEHSRTLGFVIGTVAHLHRSDSYTFSKCEIEEVVLVAGMGVEGDAHFGATVKHRSRVKADPTQPNLRQVHLMHSELHAELQREGFSVGAGDLGENITTIGLDLLSLPTGTVLRLGVDAIVALTGLRNPCPQIDNFERGVLKRVLTRDADGNVRRKAGVMGVVVLGGTVRRGDEIQVSLPPLPHVALAPV
jgi:MOSC domain-containing protein YiiM